MNNNPPVSSAPARYAIGIDLGTTNTVAAYARLGEDKTVVEVLPIPQWTAPGNLESRKSLPSFLYLLTEAEMESGGFVSPGVSGGGPERRYVVGEYARRQGADTPARTVAAAKSWLGHSRVDRREAILPWNAPSGVPRISPVEVSRRLLEQVIGAWKAAFPEAPFAEQQVVLTAPASFDASARELTREAALAAGFPEGFVLLEEPQAALYAWLGDREGSWRRELRVGETLLVCDVGGGTTDFSLIGVVDEGGALGLKRIAVGNHILVGGDNMDLLLAHLAKAAFAEKGVEVDAWQSVALWHACRNAKETLLTSGGPATHSVTVQGRGSRLIGGSISAELNRETIAEALGNGFFPACGLQEKPERGRFSGFRELGLPYETDTGITRHLAQFLSANGEGGGRAIRPTHVLFNGGVFKARFLRDRMMEALEGWFPDAPPTALEGQHDLDFAVARGAAFYAVAKQGKGVRIRGGTARAYYVGIETAGLAVPGAARPLRLVCVAPFGMEEGTEVSVPGEEIGLIVGELAQFRFFSSVARKEDQAGTVLDRRVEGEVEETDSLQAALPPAAGYEDEFVPVRFESRITELGVLELWCVSAVSRDRWKLEFNVREEADGSGTKPRTGSR